MSETPCPLCGAPIPAGMAKPITVYRKGNPRTVEVCEACTGAVSPYPETERATGRTVGRAVLCGTIGAVIGATVWVVIGMMTRYEVDYVAAFVGFATGAGVRVGAWRTRDRSLRWVAVGLTVVGLALAKLGIFAYLYHEGTGHLDLGMFRAFGSFIASLKPVQGFFLLVAVIAAWFVADPAGKYLRP